MSSPFNNAAEHASRPGDEYTEDDFALLADFLFARTDPLLLARPLGEDLDRALQALNDTIRALLAQARAFRQWNNEDALACVWDALTVIARQWDHHPGFNPHWSAHD